MMFPSGGPANRADDRLVGSVLNGKSQMTPWRGVLDVEQIESIWAFIHATLDR
jgi:hypothetical protein